MCKKTNVNEKEKEKTPTDRERERERESEKERERELGMFSMIRFDSATSCFPALLVIKPCRKKLKVQNSKEKFLTYRIEENFNIHFVLLELSYQVTHLQELKSFVAQ